MTKRLKEVFLPVDLLSPVHPNLICLTHGKRTIIIKSFKASLFGNWKNSITRYALVVVLAAYPLDTIKTIKVIEGPQKQTWYIL